jgi:hypothetical protein
MRTIRHCKRRLTSESLARPSVLASIDRRRRGALDLVEAFVECIFDWVFVHSSEESPPPSNTQTPIGCSDFVAVDLCTYFVQLGGTLLNAFVGVECRPFRVVRLGGQWFAPVGNCAALDTLDRGRNPEQSKGSNIVCSVFLPIMMAASRHCHSCSRSEVLVD